MTIHPIRDNERLTEQYEEALREAIEEQTATATFVYDFEITDEDCDELADLEEDFNERAWAALKVAASTYEKYDPDGGIKWKWSGFEENGLCVYVRTLDAAFGLLRHGFKIDC